jgi:hypothetical protein
VSDGWAEFICAVLFVAALHCIGERCARNEAVKAGVAEYYLDDHHSKQFRWRTNR